jgi:DNA-binding MarR family transcriptional regulator
VSKLSKPSGAPTGRPKPRGEVSPKTRKASGAETPAMDSASRDPISTIVAQWQRERPDIDPAPMLLFGLIARTQAMTTTFIGETLEKWKLTRPSFDVLAALRRAGPPYSLTPKQLSESLMLSGAGMTSRLDRLESLYLVARLPEPNDRRSLKIQLTDKGVRLIDEMIPDIVAAQWAVASKLGSSETDELVRLLSDFANLLGERP